MELGGGHWSRPAGRRDALEPSWDGLGGLALASLAVLELLRGHA